MNKSLYIVAFSLAFATTGIAQNNEGQDKVIDLGTQTTTELSSIYCDSFESYHQSSVVPHVMTRIHHPTIDIVSCVTVHSLSLRSVPC